MIEEVSDSEAKPFDLLYKLEHVIESDPLIDEVGFIHLSQFTSLNEEADIPALSSSGSGHQSDEINKLIVHNNNTSNTIFWNKDHKLGISVKVLLPLYTAAKHAFMASLERYKTHCMPSNLSSSSYSVLENELMKHSKVLLLISCDFGTAWNARKLVVSKKLLLPIFMDELFFSELVLSYSPKSERAWSHRRWVIKMIAEKSSKLQEIVEKESELVKKLAEKSKMNYRAWNHRCWLVSYMSSVQAWHELSKSRDWAGLHVADSSCFHYRARLLLRMQEDSWSEMELYQVWKEELDWDERLIKLYIGREALWVHRRFLSIFWIKYFAASSSGSSCFNHKRSVIIDVRVYLDDELRLFRSCTTMPDNSFEDYRTQTMLSATYIMWLTKHMSEHLGIGLQENLRAELQTLLDDISPEKSVMLDCIKA